MAVNHELDIFLEPRERQALFVNEPGLVDETAEELENADDNVRIYVPLDLNAEAILRRLWAVILKYGEANEANESDFSIDVSKLVNQVEIYDQVWFAREGGEAGHSGRARELVRRFVAMLEEIPDGCVECFPFEMIEELRDEYLEE